MHAVIRSIALVTALCAPFAAKAQSAPTAEEIFGRHVAAIGGKDAILRVRSIKNVGKMEMPAMGISATMESASAPDRSFMRLTIPGIGDIRNGYDGSVAWELNPMKGPRIKTEQETIVVQEDADFYGAMLFSKDRFVSAETVGPAEFGGEQTWQVKTVRKSGRTVNEFFSVKTGLKVGSTTAQESPGGTVNVVTVESDYQQFGSLRLATRNEMTTGAQKVVVTLTDIVLDQIPADAFVLPEPVKALVKK